MPTYYVGPGGNDGNSGLTWALRKLTLNGAEDVPVVAGDTVYVAPGAYRETLTVDVSGGAGSPITYIGDITGEHTDGVGGIVRITGSDNDTTFARNYAIHDGGIRQDYRTFRGFRLDMTDNHVIYAQSAGTNWIVEDCAITVHDAGSGGVAIAGGNQAAWTIRRCKFFGEHQEHRPVDIGHSADVDDTGHLIENCTMLSGAGGSLRISNVGGITIRHCSFAGIYRSIWMINAPAVGQTITVNNCIFTGANTALNAAAPGYIIEDYNTFFGNGTDRTNVAIGANSVSYPPLFNLGHLHAGAAQISGFQLPQPQFGDLTTWSQVRAITDTGPATLDITGLTRPVTAGKRSYGACQYDNVLRDTGTVYSGPSSLELSDYGRTQFYVPVTGVQITVSIYVYLEANYAGNAPQMICKQPGQADRATTATGATGAWEELTDTFTPAADPEWIVVELVSRNTAAAGNYAVYFDALTVT